VANCRFCAHLNGCGFEFLILDGATDFPIDMRDFASDFRDVLVVLRGEWNPLSDLYQFFAIKHVENWFNHGPHFISEQM